MRPPLGTKGLILLLGLFLASGGSMAWADGSDGGEGSGHHHTESGGSSGDGGSNDHHGSTGESHDSGSGDSNSGGETEGGNQSDGSGTLGSVQDSHELNESPEKEQEEARQAVATGKAAPLTKLLEKLKTAYPGQILDVGLVRLPNKLKFSVKYIDVKGVVKTVTLDALTLEDE